MADYAAKEAMANLKEAKNRSNNAEDELKKANNAINELERQITGHAEQAGALRQRPSSRKHRIKYTNREENLGRF